MGRGLESLQMVGRGCTYCCTWDTCHGTRHSVLRTPSSLNAKTGPWLHPLLSLRCSHFQKAMLLAEITKGKRTLGTTAGSGLLATPSAVGEFNYSTLPLLGLGSQGTLQQLMNKASRYLQEAAMPLFIYLLHYMWGNRCTKIQADTFKVTAGSSKAGNRTQVFWLLVLWFKTNHEKAEAPLFL